MTSHEIDFEYFCLKSADVSKILAQNMAYVPFFECSYLIAFQRGVDHFHTNSGWLDIIS